MQQTAEGHLDSLPALPEFPWWWRARCRNQHRRHHLACWSLGATQGHATPTTSVPPLCESAGRIQGTLFE